MLSIKARPNLIKAAYEFTLLDFASVKQQKQSNFFLFMVTCNDLLH